MPASEWDHISPQIPTLNQVALHHLYPNRALALLVEHTGFESPPGVVPDDSDLEEARSDYLACVGPNVSIDACAACGRSEVRGGTWKVDVICVVQCEFAQALLVTDEDLRSIFDLHDDHKQGINIVLLSVRGDDMYFFLVPELVSGRDEGATAGFCQDCKKITRHDLRSSMAARKWGRKTEIPARIRGDCGLPHVSDLEATAVAKNVMYKKIITLSSADRATVNLVGVRPTLTGHIACIPHTGAHSLSRILPRDDLDSLVSILFVGSAQSWGRLAGRMNSGHTLLRLEACLFMLGLFKALGHPGYELSRTS